jgi:hypothetical protein
MVLQAPMVHQELAELLELVERLVLMEHLAPMEVLE